jgi:hypothetical protein
MTDMSYSHFRLFAGGLCCLGFGALLAGCATGIQTGSRLTPGVSFAHRSTFRFLPDQSREAAEAVSNSSYWRGEIGQDILSAMNTKGYRFFPNRKTISWLPTISCWWKTRRLQPWTVTPDTI